MKIYTGYLTEAHLIERNEEPPEIGEVVVSLDLQNRLGGQTWLVFIQGDGTSQDDSIQVGLFWNVGAAVEFAILLNDNHNDLFDKLSGY